jgi:hypothetical protein
LAGVKTIRGADIKTLVLLLTAADGIDDRAKGLRPAETITL